MGDSGLQGQIDFTLISQISLTPTSAQVGKNVTVKGMGFANGEVVTLKLGTADIGNATVGATGEFSHTFSVPFLGGGPKPVRAIGNGGGEAEHSFSILGRITGIYAVQNIAVVDND